MPDSSASTQCPACGCANATSSTFCQKCGQRLVRPCSRCGAQNLLLAEFCGSCGVGLADAKLGISEDEAGEWWDRFCSHPGFCSVWSRGGYGESRVLPLAKQIRKASDPDPLVPGERIAFYLPIADRDWCVGAAHLGGPVIRRGMLWTAESGLAFFDFAQRRAYRILYESLASVRRDGDSIRLATTGGDTLDFWVRVPRPSKAARTAGCLVSVLAMLGSKSYADRELLSQSNRRAGEEFAQKVERAERFVEDIYEFFAKIIRRGQELGESSLESPKGGEPVSNEGA